MKTVIVGCGRVGSVLADAFDRLPGSFRGNAVRGDGTDEDTLRRAGAEGADVFMAMTEGDNRNVMSAQLAVEALGVTKVIAKINDPLRAAAYAELGIATLCRTGLMVDAVNGYLGLPPSGFSGMLAPTGTHPGGDHHEPMPTTLGGTAGGPAVAAGAPTTPDQAAAPGAALEA